jgi:hypothetical protein
MTPSSRCFTAVGCIVVDLGCAQSTTLVGGMRRAWWLMFVLSWDVSSPLSGCLSAVGTETGLAQGPRCRHGCFIHSVAVPACLPGNATGACTGADLHSTPTWCCHPKRQHAAAHVASVRVCAGATLFFASICLQLVVWRLWVGGADFVHNPILAGKHSMASLVDGWGLSWGILHVAVCVTWVTSTAKPVSCGRQRHRKSPWALCVCLDVSGSQRTQSPTWGQMSDTRASTPCGAAERGAA